MSQQKCGSVVGGDDPNFQGEGHDCPNAATRISHVYESFSVYVCDVDHEGLEPWLENTIEDLADETLALDRLRCLDDGPTPTREEGGSRR